MDIPWALCWTFHETPIVYRIVQFDDVDRGPLRIVEQVMGLGITFMLSRPQLKKCQRESTFGDMDLC